MARSRSPEGSADRRRDRSRDRDRDARKRERSPAARDARAETRDPKRRRSASPARKVDRARSRSRERARRPDSRERNRERDRERREDNRDAGKERETSDRKDRDRERDRDRDRDRDRERDRDRDLTATRRRDGDRDDRGREADRSTKDSSPKCVYVQDREREKELLLIKQQYLGTEKVRKKTLKPSEKFRFNFDWEAQDDTSKDLNPLYNNTHEAALLFGRGLRAGVDRREQMKAAAAHQNDVMKKMRQSAGVSETKEDRQRDKDRKQAAEMYDDFDKRVEKHWTEKAREEMTERDWRIFREDFSIAYKGNTGSTLPIRNWQEAGLPQPLMDAIEKMKYVKPSPIQMAAIPLGLKFRDVIGVAETGSGKTAAFVFPMLVYIMNQPKMTEEIAAEGPYAVVMAPTRELAQQIEEETMKLAQFTEFRMVSVVGGQSIEDQGFKLRKGCEIVIATPGRLLDCLEQRYAVLNQCNYVVLDEADRMIDMGFEPQVRGVLDAMPSTNLKPEQEDEELEENRVYRTTYMFSATMPPAVERLARKYMRRPVVINIGSAGKATDSEVVICKDNDKLRLLEDQLSRVGDKRVIVFVNTKTHCDVVSRHLDHLSYHCTVLHGGKTQDQREAGLAGFREDKYNVLVATDVAGRGIDVPDVAAVINYDMPHSIEQYTHRIGRTGRAGKTGYAVTFLTMSDTEVFYDLKRLLEESGANVPSQLAHHEASKVKPGSVQDRPRKDQVVYSNK
ncbi:P-loop containing nucleoside triphosphate hydrolase protein [Coccomyxa subellipsoidea C-169]|uniref:DEAD-box ATP-dependent RNA helicase 21 n=1 Tax=Coccomyxa subellipsoidea (strain C-169) TaxID=574566 RepID=I0Z208_COCSC|nr:P-loop containing nucleoside triphosphate hydrolase protein [Coccomyxa subellipsoidea C-169]EIE24677.1 P-loop containing nucleoside triphosphate hydrolase protein [Coccomyxa subellipsoidea C-169]|eukprot:XP_005649221.1 P-loop containing nucleoside triphosphate hydrolase protein [Coccomyxa subellipsoidea C-169]